MIGLIMLIVGILSVLGVLGWWACTKFAEPKNTVGTEAPPLAPVLPKAKGFIIAKTPNNFPLPSPEESAKHIACPHIAPVIPEGTIERYRDGFNPDDFATTLLFNKRDITPHIHGKDIPFYVYGMGWILFGGRDGSQDYWEK